MKKRPSRSKKKHPPRPIINSFEAMVKIEPQKLTGQDLEVVKLVAKGLVNLTELFKQGPQILIENCTFKSQNRDFEIDQNNKLTKTPNEKN